jgi:hypothetical protein
MTLLAATTAFASAAHASGNLRSFAYSCELEESNSLSKNPICCKVEGIRCESHPGIEGTSGSQECRDRESRDPIRIECSNGFDLRDRDAAFALKRDDLFIIAEDENRGHRERQAVLELEDVLRGEATVLTPSSEPRRVDAELIIADGVAKSLRGRCKIRLLDNYPSPSPVPALR